MRHRVISKVIICVICIFFTHNSLFARFAGGSGTQEDPYLVSNAAQLNNIRNHPEAYFVQTADINLSGYNGNNGWQPIGEYHVWGHPLNNPFKGSYNGGGYKIENLTIKKPEINNAGLFGYIGKKAHISNVTLKGADISGHVNVGALVGHNKEGTISKSYVKGNVYGYRHTGVLAGRNEGEIINCHSAGSVKGYHSVGGLAGRNDGTISKSYSVSTVSGRRVYGGLTGNNTGEIDNSYYDRETSSQDDSEKGVPKTTAEMMKKDTFGAWDFTNIWDIVEGESYPFLQ